MFADPYATRQRRFVLVVSALMPIALAAPMAQVVWPANANPVTAVLRLIWLLLPAVWTFRVIGRIGRRQRLGLPVDEQTVLLYRVAMLIPVIGYVPMLWMLH